MADKNIVKEDMICPSNGRHCDDECCTVGSTCNLSNNFIETIDDLQDLANRIKSQSEGDFNMIYDPNGVFDKLKQNR